MDLLTLSLALMLGYSKLLSILSAESKDSSGRSYARTQKNVARLIITAICINAVGGLQWLFTGTEMSHVAGIAVLTIAGAIYGYATRGLKWRFRSRKKNAANIITSAAGATMEELIFRGTLLTGLSTQVGVPLAVLISSLLFGLVHYPEQSLRHAVEISMIGVILSVAAVSGVPLIYLILTHMVLHLPLILRCTKRTPGNIVLMRCYRLGGAAVSLMWLSYASLIGELS